MLVIGVVLWCLGTNFGYGNTIKSLLVQNLVFPSSIVDLSFSSNFCFVTFLILVRSSSLQAMSGPCTSPKSASCNRGCLSITRELRIEYPSQRWPRRMQVRFMSQTRRHRVDENLRSKPNRTLIP